MFLIELFETKEQNAICYAHKESLSRALAWRSRMGKCPSTIAAQCYFPVDSGVDLRSMEDDRADG